MSPAKHSDTTIPPLPPTPKKVRIEKPLELPEHSDISDDSDMKEVPTTSTEPVTNHVEEDFDGSMSPHTPEEAPDVRTVVHKENENCENEASENSENKESENK